MDRSTWLKEQRRLAEEHEDTLYAPIYDQHWGDITPTHRQFLDRFLSLCPPHGLILDAPCGTGKYWGIILASGRTVFGADQSRGMLARAHEKFPVVPFEKVGLQEMRYAEAFDGAVCIDALEMIPPEDWPLVLDNLYRAIKPAAYLYFTIEIAEEKGIANAFTEAQNAGMPVVYGEWVEGDDTHADWALSGFYHYYPRIDQVKEWVRQANLHLVDDLAEGEYHHFLVQKK